MFKVTEKFQSIQGEGAYVGTPSLFIRLFGCPFTCEGFGQPRDKSKWIPKDKLPHNLIDVKDVTSIKDLPVPSVGCDSSAAWAKHLEPLSEECIAADLASWAAEYMPSSSAVRNSEFHVVITGGEPLMPKWQKQFPELIDRLIDECSINNLHLVVTFETNGVYALKEHLSDYLKHASGVATFIFSVSPKLSISGEPRKVAINPKSVTTYVSCGYVYLKYVVRDSKCVEEALQATQEYREAACDDIPVYLMPEGALVEQQQETLSKGRIAELCMKHNVNFSPRLHCDLFGNEWGT